VLVTETIVGDEPFAVILADDVYDATPPALKQMIDVFEKAGGPVLAVERVPMEQVSSYGVIDGEPAPDLGKGVYRVTDLVEKPPREEAPSDLAIIGRYILTPDIFPASSRDRERQVGRNSADQRTAKAAEVAADLRAEDRWRASRHREQAGLLEGERLLRVEAAEIAGPFREYLKSLK
jgi:UTP--glucose-1-phosphate uridylyltransferase